MSVKVQITEIALLSMFYVFLSKNCCKNAYIVFFIRLLIDHGVTQKAQKKHFFNLFKFLAF